MPRILPTFTAIACALTLAAGLVTVSYELGTRAAPDSAGPSLQSLPAEFGVLAELYGEITTDAVDVPSDRVLAEGALEGMLGSLEDPYAVYYDEAALADFEESLEGRLSGGIGVMIEDTPDGPVVVSVLPDTPAEAACVEVGERIVSVDGRDVRELPISEIVAQVTGEEGTEVRIGLEGGSQGPRELVLTRASFDVPITEAELLDDNVGMVRLIHFSRNAAEQLRADVESLTEQGAQGFILDLRRNPGGLLREAIDVASVFVEDVVITRVQESASEEVVHRAGSNAATDLPLVVLVDEGTASAAEVLAGAFQDLGRAEIVGEQTFGKGTVQTIKRLSDGSGAKFTTARYSSPDGRQFEGNGLRPDTPVADEEEQVAVARRVLLGMIAGAATGGG